MIYVGIDIAKLNHFASAISSDGQELMKPFKFTNDGDGFQMLISRLTELSYEDDNIIIGLESTAHYGDNLVRYLVSCNYNVCVLNPSKPRSCVNITFARLTLTRSIHSSLPKHLCCRLPTGLSLSMTLT